VQGIDAYSFFTNAAFSSPSNLLAQFPNLQIISTNFVGATNIVSTNVFITNIVSTSIFTNTRDLTIISNLDLFTFSEASRTNGPNALRALYPTLIITSTNSAPVLDVTPIFSLTNYPWAVVGSPPVVVTNYVTNIVANYQYTYANVITNYASAVTDLEVRDVVRAPWSTVGSVFFVTNRAFVRIPKTSGGFYILDRSTNANLIAYSEITSNGVPLVRVTNYVQFTNVVVTNLVAGTRSDVLSTFTNVVFATYPVFLNGSLGDFMVTNFVTNIFSRFDYTFGNLLYFPPGNGNTGQVLQTTIFLGGQPFTTVQTIPSEFPQGTVLILDTNQFILTGQRIETSGLATNILINFTNAATGDFILQQLIRQTNGILFAVNPVLFQSASGLALRPGINSIHFTRIPYVDFQNQSNTLFTNIYTSIIQTNGVRFTNIFRRVSGPDILFRAADVGVTPDPAPVAVTRTIGRPIQQDSGPGTINPGATITFTKLLPSRFNQDPSFLTEFDSFDFGAWGSFDGKPTPPIVYPESLQGPANTNLLRQLEDIALGRTPRP
jgi:hypothetical protein